MKLNSRKDITKTAKPNEIETRRAIHKINEIRVGSQRRAQISVVGDEKRAVTPEAAEIQRFTRMVLEFVF